MGEMYHSKQVEEDAVEAIWDKIEKFSHTLRKDTSVSGTSDTTVVTPLTGTAGITELGACLRIVSMIAHTVPSILSEERVGLVISAGLAPEVLQKGDFSALKAAVLCLQASPPFLKNCITVSERNAYVGSKLQVTLLEATPMITTIMMGTHCGNNEAVTRYCCNNMCWCGGSAVLTVPCVCFLSQHDRALTFHIFLLHVQRMVCGV